MPYVIVKELPESIRAALRAVGYGKKDIDVEVGEMFAAPLAYGTGHRAQVVVVHLASGSTKETHGAWGGENAFSRNPVDQFGAKSVLPEGFVALTSGMTGIWHLHVNPANAAKLLPEASAVTPREKWILYTFKSLTSAGRKSEWEYAGKDRPHADEVAALEARGFLKTNKAGSTSITTDGKNVFKGFEQPRMVPRETVTADDILRGAGVKR